ncbi:succinate dehydrogenase [ubiquinone] cytochrome b small subunit A, mitochondrial [Exaiptasia diaphana]|uniref:Succinate dehydrogenase [ubiquinone] cytochrome b small subunit n=1 Tax=Exaiptasia diaphana TaxID=2652724 RepID=A0A913XD09_EXADI|nr:succinate dehydrogenase [ubiquinone] cytochrome b small subunit A, mitochondrial [Exaiptasia diaphana]KXJ29660.1 Succinate dehydrogenase [ubiquinone] cytochrome b small subunit, mitochondrial [Exaiptasia diaphana]
MAAILFGRLCGRSSRFVISSTRPILASSSMTCFPTIQNQKVPLTKAIHSTSSNKKTTLEIAPSTASTHWILERGFSIALLALIPAGIFYPCAAVDWGLAICIPVHNHWGIHAILADYVNKGPKMPARARGIWLVLTVLQFMGLCYFNINDVGICQGIKMIWNI